MTEQDKPRRRRTRSRRKRQPSRLRTILSRVWSEWRVEIFIVLLVALAIFLLVERMQIRQTVLALLSKGLAAIQRTSGEMLQAMLRFLRGTTLSDFVGYILLLLALAFVVWRLRWRLKTMPRFTSSACPQCGSELHRVHRRSLDRALNLFVPLRRFRCKNPDCDWEGLRVRPSRHD